jgi:hypothetical protein
MGEIDPSCKNYKYTPPSNEKLKRLNKRILFANIDKINNQNYLHYCSHKKNPGLIGYETLKEKGCYKNCDHYIRLIENQNKKSNKLEREVKKTKENITKKKKLLNTKIFYAPVQKTKNGLQINICSYHNHFGVIGKTILEERNCLTGCIHYKSYITDTNTKILTPTFPKETKKEKTSKKEKTTTKLERIVQKKITKQTTKKQQKKNRIIPPEQRIIISEPEKKTLKEIIKNPSLIGLKNATLLESNLNTQAHYNAIFKTENSIILYKHRKNSQTKGLIKIQENLSYYLKLIDSKKIPNSFAICGDTENIIQKSREGDWQKT